jgi:hypothetical protein
MMSLTPGWDFFQMVPVGLSLVVSADSLPVPGIPWGSIPAFSSK